MKMRNLAVMSLLVFGLFLAACTRQASTQPVPTNPPAQSTTGAAEDPTMAAVRLTAAVRATQAVADTETAQPAGSVPQSTPQAGELTPQATPMATDLTQAAVVPTDTPAVAAAAATPVPTACPNPYLVQQGDWIYKIARDCQVSPASILAANPGIYPNFITPGQKLNMPAPGGTAALTSCSGTYTVVAGDTLYNIAYRCGLTTEQMATANSISYPFVIHAGDVLKFP